MSDLSPAGESLIDNLRSCFSGDELDFDRENNRDKKDMTCTNKLLGLDYNNEVYVAMDCDYANFIHKTLIYN